jgi:hypothetical protein
VSVMVDPLVGAVVKKAVDSVGSGTESTTTNILQRVFGPPADELGKALARVVAFKTQNFGRIIEKADSRLVGKELTGEVNPRVGFVMLEEGSLCDDELMAEYLGGVLAASRSSDGRDDRAVTWTHIVTGLSSFQIRAHYLLYREWAKLLNDLMPDIDLSYSTEMELANICLDLGEFESALMQDSEAEPEAILRHSIFGLTRAGLLNDTWLYGSPQKSGWRSCPFDNYIKVTPTGRGIELYGWALGFPDLLPKTFASRAASGNIEDDEIPRLESLALSSLYEDLPKFQRVAEPKAKVTAGFLKGLAKCESCRRLLSVSKDSTEISYFCRNDSCAGQGTTLAAALLDAYIAEVLVAYLERPEVAAQLGFNQSTKDRLLSSAFIAEIRKAKDAIQQERDREASIQKLLTDISEHRELEPGTLAQKLESSKVSIKKKVVSS